MYGTRGTRGRSFNYSQILAQEVLDIWQKASLKTGSRKRILQLIRAYHDKYRSLMKPYHGRQTNINYQQKFNTFTAESLIDYLIFAVANANLSQIVLVRKTVVFPKKT